MTPAPSTRLERSTCPRCGQPVTPLDDTYQLDNHRAHIVCPPPTDLPAA